MAGKPVVYVPRRAGRGDREPGPCHGEALLLRSVAVDPGARSGGRRTVHRFGRGQDVALLVGVVRQCPVGVVCVEQCLNQELVDVDVGCGVVDKRAFAATLNEAGQPQLG